MRCITISQMCPLSHQLSSKEWWCVTELSNFGSWNELHILKIIIDSFILFLEIQFLNCHRRQLVWNIGGPRSLRPPSDIWQSVKSSYKTQWRSQEVEVEGWNISFVISLVWGNDQTYWEWIEGEAQTEGTKRPRFEVEARIESEARNWMEEGSGRGLGEPLPRKFWKFILETVQSGV